MPPPSAAVGEDVDAARAGVDGVLHQFLDHAGRPLDHLAGGDAVKNRDLWERLHGAAGRHDVDWRWVKGHAGNEGNELADQLASRGAQEARDA